MKGYECDSKEPADDLGCLGYIGDDFVHWLPDNPRRANQSGAQGTSDDDCPLSSRKWESVCGWVAAQIRRGSNHFHGKEQTPAGSAEIATLLLSSQLCSRPLHAGLVGGFCCAPTRLPNTLNGYLYHREGTRLGSTCHKSVARSCTARRVLRRAPRQKCG